ncbi:DnaJ protein [uncultured Synechococcales cyanobacterium]|uniref:DnaJ protein n=1 Tax=uncultured Synechococcales cyanobacterium TaxID=1936017 RepID=A0A6J4VL29_9CYAN|nr:DnaJ protein [uncultured Synechococcales cyanobacterium]
MTDNKAAPDNSKSWKTVSPSLGSTYYTMLGLTPSASVQDIRRAYRDMSKRYHPDTTDLPSALATEKFQQLNAAYATLSSPERRLVYDQKIGFSRVHVIQASQPMAGSASFKPLRSSAYIDASDRSLSPGELFALFILGATFLACLLLAITIGLTGGDTVWQSRDLTSPPNEPVLIQQEPLSRQPQQVASGLNSSAPNEVIRTKYLQTGL